MHPEAKEGPRMRPASNNICSRLEERRRWRGSDWERHAMRGTLEVRLGAAG